MYPTVEATEAFDCPSLERIVEFDLGKLSESESLSFADHLSSCERCEKILLDLRGRLDDDSVIACLKRCLGSPKWDEPAYLEMKQLAETVQGSFFERGHPVGFDGPRVSPSPNRGGFPKLDKYELLEEIGDGGMGVVYRGRQLALGWIVAVKMISSRRHASQKTIARFVREGKALARLEHPNVVEIYDFDFQDGLPYFAMELMPGGNLHAKLAKGPLEPREASELVRTLARAVDYLHRRGIVHRDLKPANILLSHDGTPKISDFGLAKLLDSDSDGPQSPPLTDTGTLLGTVQYMAPEQLFARSIEVGPAIDIYALGAILYELLTGQPPFTAATKLQVLDLVRTRQPVPPSRTRAEVPAWLEEVCLKCLEKSPSLRYPTAEALAVDLDRWLSDDREKPKPTLRRAGRIWRKVRRPGAIAAACAVPLLLLALGVGRDDPVRTLGRIRADLAGGQAVSLIDKTGTPKWHRWLAGEADGKLTRGRDETTTLLSWETAIVELIPDPRSDRYRITAQIRHDQSDTSGEVGLYFAHATYPLKPHEVQFFLQVAFNAIRGTADVRARIPFTIKLPKKPSLNEVNLRPHLYSPGKEHSHFDVRLDPTHGPKFEPVNPSEGHWHDLEVLVTPEALTVRWDGRAFAANVGELQQRIDADFRADSPLREGQNLPATFRPQIDLRGGLGLYLRGGAASYRSLRIEPLRNP